MNVSLKDVLSLVGTLDDSSSGNAPRDRFRDFIRNTVKEVGELRDYVDECLRNSGDQFNRALQDLINITGQFLGFEVTFGRYRGTTADIGFDGLWKSPTGRFLVVEAKTTETYAIKTATLLGYTNELISCKQIPDRDSTL